MEKKFPSGQKKVYDLDRNKLTQFVTTKHISVINLSFITFKTSNSFIIYCHQTHYSKLIVAKFIDILKNEHILENVLCMSTVNRLYTISHM